MKFVFRWLLLLEARLLLRRRSPRVLLITGTVGKTTAKDTIAAVLSSRFTTRASGEEGNLLLPLAILGLPPLSRRPLDALKTLLRGAAAPFVGDHPAWLILEADPSAPGRVSSISRWLRPDLVVLTAIGDTPPHLDAFPSRDELIDEALQAVHAARPGGVVVVNADDADLVDRVRTIRPQHPMIAFGFLGTADVTCLASTTTYADLQPTGLRLLATSDESEATEEIPGVLGRQHAYAALAALAVAMAVGVPAAEAALAIGGVARQPGRLRLVPGAGGSVILDDTWSGSAPAWAEALRAFGELKAQGRKIVLLSGLPISGDTGAALHTQVGAAAADVSDLLVVLEPHAAEMAAGARCSGIADDRLIVASDPASAGMSIRRSLAKGDLVLVLATGSMDVDMERAVEQMMLEPDRKAELLVRQAPWWDQRR
jgi:UDP-N-acetylmuramoyl-tripeptide--D-alanyl-D-alanine ligase